MADRLVNYADAIAAFSVVSCVTFLLALTELEIRCSLADRSTIVYTGLVLQALVYSCLVIVCHKTEARIRDNKQTIPKDLQSLRTALIWIRILIIFIATLGIIPLVILAVEDSACASIGA